MNNQEFEDTIKSFKNKLIEDIIKLVIDDYFFKHSYDILTYLAMQYNIEYWDPSPENVTTYWEYNVESIEEFVSRYVPKELSNYYLWKGYNAKNILDIYDNNLTEYTTLSDDNNFASLLNSLNENPNFENIEELEEESPFEKENYISEYISLQDDDNYASLLENLKTNTSYERQMLHQIQNRLEEYLNENPYCEDKKAIEGYIKQNWLKEIMTSKDGKYYYSLDQSGKEQDKELTIIKNFKQDLNRNNGLAYKEFYDIWTSISKSFKFDIIKLNEIIKILDSSSNLKTDIIKLLKSENRLYFISAIINMKNAKNKSFCIFAFNMIFNHNLKFKEYTEEKINKITKLSELEVALNTGLTLNDIPDFLSIIISNSYCDKEIFQKYALDINAQDHQGNTIIMQLLINCKEWYYAKKMIIELLKLDFNLYLKNNEGLNTLEVAESYCQNKEINKVISKIYGIKYSEEEEKFSKDIAVLRKKIKS